MFVHSLICCQTLFILHVIQCRAGIYTAFQKQNKKPNQTGKATEVDKDIEKAEIGQIRRNQAVVGQVEITKNTWLCWKASVSRDQIAT